VECQGCAPPLVCDPQGQCVCPPLKTCADYPNQCGTFSDGCTGTVTCDCPDAGPCSDGGCCFAKTCADFPGQCGTLSDGCGGTIDCTCADGGVCADGGSCCLPKTCQDLGKNCGQWPDGCGGMTPDCGMCGSGRTCVDGVCTCVDAGSPCAGKQCGTVVDPCDGTIVNCGTCPPDPHYACVNNQCVCTPDTCESLGKNCGTWPAGCGMPDLNCGICPPDPNAFCNNGVCQCTPDACPGGPNQCPDGCGNSVPCSCGPDYEKCSAGACVCAQDAWEPNDGVASAKGFVDPSLPASDPSNTFNDTDNRSVARAPNVHAAQNNDWYVVRVVDANLNGTAVADLRLTEIPSPSDYDLHVFWTCSAGNSDVTCNVGTASQCQGTACCRSLRAGSADEQVNASLRCKPSSPATGLLYVAVAPFAWQNTCAHYKLTVTVSP
jgi:hypothetical protein